MTSRHMCQMAFFSQPALITKIRNVHQARRLADHLWVANVLVSAVSPVRRRCFGSRQALALRVPATASRSARVRPGRKDGDRPDPGWARRVQQGLVVRHWSIDGSPQPARAVRCPGPMARLPGRDPGGVRATSHLARDGILGATTPSAAAATATQAPAPAAAATETPTPTTAAELRVWRRALARF
jgi:hypothetical protein